MPRMNANRRESSERASIERVAEQVIAAAYEVGNALGAGFLEKVTSERY